MILELIPVIEIGYNNRDVPRPEKYPYWEYSELWDKFNSESIKKAGLKDEFKPFLAGSSFYRLSDITDSNLTKLVIDHTQDLRDGKYKREQASALFVNLKCKANKIYSKNYHYFNTFKNSRINYLSLQSR